MANFLPSLVSTQLSPYHGDPSSPSQLIYLYHPNLYSSHSPPSLYFVSFFRNSNITVYIVCACYCLASLSGRWTLGGKPLCSAHWSVHMFRTDRYYRTLVHIKLFISSFTNKYWTLGCMEIKWENFFSITLSFQILLNLGNLFAKILLTEWTHVSVATFFLVVWI